MYNGKPVFSEADVAEIGEYIAKLPTAAELGKMSDADRAAFADHRRWALVYFALSLAQNPASPLVPFDRRVPRRQVAEGSWQTVSSASSS